MVHRKDSFYNGISQLVFEVTKWDASPNPFSRFPWEGILLIPITFHVIGEECIYNINMVNYSSTTSSLHMYLSIAIQADKGSSINCSSGGGQDNVDRSTGGHIQTRILSVEADQSRGDVGTNQMTSLAEGNTSCESVLLVYLYPACSKYTCPNIQLARALSSISLIIQPPDHTDSSDQSVIDSIHGSPGSSMANFVDPSTGVTCCQSVEVQPLGGDVNPGNYYLEDPLVAAAAYGNNMQNW